MYKIIIVDDEPGAQEIIAAYINKSQIGYEVLACLSDGEETLDYLKTNNADVIITDIRMPGMSGIELAQKLNEAKSGIKVVIVSGYSEFEYAKKAIEYNVFNYLLKPIDVEELIECLQTIKSVLDSEKQKDLYVAEMLLLQREQFFADLFMGALNSKAEIEDAFKKLNFPFEIADTAVKILQVELPYYYEFLKNHWNHGKEKLGLAVLNVVEKVVQEIFIYPVSHKGKKMVFILFSSSGFENEINTGRIAQEIKNVIRLDTSINTVSSFANLFELAENAAVEENENEMIMLLISHIQSGDVEGAKNILERFIRNKIQYRTSDSKEEILNGVVNKMVSYFGDHNHSIELKKDLKNIQKTPESVVNLLSDNYLEEEDLVVNKAKAFIVANYKNDISRQDVADHVFLNSAYLGKYFKQKTGKTIYEYLLEVRMKKALELLNAHMKISKISEMVGYKNQRHFLRVFKEYSGYTPSEYRRKVLKMEEYGDEGER